MSNPPKSSGLTRHNLRALLVLLALGSSALSSQADTAYFTGTDPNADWLTPSNWSNNFQPGSGDDARIEDGLSAQLSGTTTVNQVFVGFDTAGTLTITGPGAFLTTNGGLIVDNQGDLGSSLLISNGATVNTLYTSLNGGSLTVTGSATTLTTAANFVALGASGGSFRVQDGAHVSALSGLSASDGGSILVSGTGSVVDLADASPGLELSSSGSALIENGGAITSNGQVDIGGGATFTVSGTGSSFTSSNNNMFIGESGTGSLIVQNGAHASAGYLSTGQSSGDVGLVTVTGSGSQLSLISAPDLGRTGSGTMSVLNGGTVVVGSATQTVSSQGRIAYGSALLISGTGSRLTDYNDMILGNNGTGLLRVDDGGVLDIQGQLFAQNGASIIQTSGTLLVGSYLQMSGNGSYSLQGGTLSIGNNATFGGSGTGYSFTMSGGTVKTAFANTSSVRTTLQTGTNTFDAGAPLTWSGTISGTGSLTKAGSSVLVLSAANTYSGGTLLASGTLSLGNNAALGTGSLEFTGASTVIANATRTVANNVIIDSGVSGTFAGSSNITQSGTISGSGTLVKAGSSTLTLTATNTYSGGTRIDAGTVNFASAASLGSGTVALNGGSLQWASGNTGDISSRLGLGSNGGTIDTGANAVAFATGLSGAGGLTKAGTGTLTLSASNAYTGNTTLSAGTLRLDNANALANSGTLVFNGGALQGNGTALTVASRLSLSSSGTISGASNLTFTNTLANSAANTLAVSNTGTTTFSGPIALSSNATARVLTFNTSGGPVIVSGSIANGGTATSGGVTKSGAGSLTLSGSNTYSGTTTLTGGTLVAGHNSALGTSLLLFNGGTLQGDSSRTLANTLSLGANSAIGGADALNLTGTLTNTGAYTLAVSNTGTTTLGAVNLSSNATARTLTLNVTGSPLVVNGVIASGSGAASQLAKTGTGTLILAANNTYSGGTTLTAGTLRASNNGAAGTGAITVNGGVFLVDAGVSVANTVKLQGGQYQRSLNAGADLANAVNATSSFAGGTPDTTAKILQGALTNAGSLTTSFAATSGALNDSIRLSDVYSFQGTGSDIFVLQLSMTSVSANSFLGWLDTTTNTWVNAVSGNTGGTATFIAGAYDSSVDFQLGYYGVDTATGTVWAVVNHNSDFAVIPEPPATILMGLGLAGVLLFCRRALRNSATPRG